MDIPIELFLGFTGISIVLAIFGFLRNPQIPATIVMGGMFLLVLSVATTNIIMGFSENSFVEQDTIYNVITNSANANLISSSSIRAERIVNSASELIGKSFDCMSVPLQKIGSPPVETLVTFGVFDSSATLVKSFGTLNVTSIGTGFFFYDMCLIEGDSWTIGSLPIGTERIGVSYGVGDASNTITSRVDAGDPFDGSNTDRTTWNGATWTDTPNSDMSMILYLRGHENGFENVNYEFTELPKTLFALIGVMIMLVGGLMVMRD